MLVKKITRVLFLTQIFAFGNRIKHPVFLLPVYLSASLTSFSFKSTSTFCMFLLFSDANLLKTRAGFYGLVANLVINGIRYDLVYPGQFIDHPLEQLNAVMNSSYDQCMMTPCFHGGDCYIIENEVNCDCLRGFLGSRCEIRGERL